MLKRWKQYKQRSEASKELARLVACLAWLETQEAHVFITADRVEVDIMGDKDAKLCTGVGDNMLEALEDALNIRRQQEGR